MSGPPADGPTLTPGSVPGYEARLVPAFRAAKAYRCPTCEQPIAPRTGHVVAWPEDIVEERRHWHHHCWRLAVRRGRVSGSRDTRRDR
jgi:hypothetical protein